MSNTFLPCVAEDWQPHHDVLHQHVRIHLLRRAVKASVEPFGLHHGTAATKHPLCPVFGEQVHQSDVWVQPSVRQMKAPLISGKADVDKGLESR